MKKLFLLTVFALFASNVHAGGFNCPELGKKLELSKNEAGEWYFVNPNTKIPMGNEVDAYQDRWFVYNVLIEQATIRFPYMPEILLVYHVMKSNKKFRAGFKLVDDVNSTQYVRLPKMYCKALIKAIDETEF